MKNVKLTMTAESIGVDAGLIIVADIGYAKDVKKFGFCRAELKRLGEIFKVPNGHYNVSYGIADTWNGPVSGSAVIKVTGGAIFVCDPCYPIGKDAKGKHTDGWGQWLSDTEFGENLHTDKAFTISSMGGDGCYNVELVLEKI